MKAIFLGAVLALLCACQPVADGAASARIFANCAMGAASASGTTSGKVNEACVYVNTSGATTSTPTTTTTPTTSVTVPVSAVPALP